MPKRERRAEIFSVCLSPAELRAVKEAAERAGRPASGWARDLILNAVRSSAPAGVAA